MRRYKLSSSQPSLGCFFYTLMLHMLGLCGMLGVRFRAPLQLMSCLMNITKETFMSTNRKFKKGDSVVAIVPLKGAGHPLVFGKVHKITGYTVAGSLNLDGVDYKAYHEDRFMPERDYVEMCINALRERDIGIITTSISTDYPVWHQDGVSKSIEGLLDYLYPVVPEETEEEKQLRELEEQQRKLADDMKALREKINANSKEQS